MKAAIVVIAVRPDVVDFFLRHQERAIPREHRVKALSVFSEIKLIVLRPEENATLWQQLNGRVAEYDAIACLVERPLLDLITDNNYGLFVVEFCPPLDASKLMNSAARNISGWLPNFCHLGRKMQRGLERSIMLLPYRVFKCDALPGLGKKLREMSIEGKFKSVVDSFVGSINERRSPKRKDGSRAEKYYIDDANYYFQYGHEQHGAAATGGAHSESCSIEKSFRFGFRIGDNRHYNLSREGGRPVSDDFLGCHDLEPLRRESNTHLNVFPNNFFG